MSGRYVFEKLEDAPKPEPEGRMIYVKDGEGGMRTYTAKDGQWIGGHRIYPALTG